MCTVRRSQICSQRGEPDVQAILTHVDIFQIWSRPYSSPPLSVARTRAWAEVEISFVFGIPGRVRRHCGSWSLLFVSLPCFQHSGVPWQRFPARLGRRYIQTARHSCSFSTPQNWETPNQTAPDLHAALTSLWCSDPHFAPRRDSTTKKQSTRRVQ